MMVGTGDIWLKPISNGWIIEIENEYYGKKYVKSSDEALEYIRMVIGDEG
jgi:hypothetical protein